MWPADRQIHSGQLHGALGLHPGHHQHHGLPHPLLPGLQPGQPAGQAAARGLPGGGERYQSEGGEDRPEEGIRVDGKRREGVPMERTLCKRKENSWINVFRGMGVGFKQRLKVQA